MAHVIGAGVLSVVVRSGPAGQDRCAWHASGTASEGTWHRVEPLASGLTVGWGPSCKQEFQQARREVEGRHCPECRNPAVSRLRTASDDD